ncbi:MAG: Rieske 2Fe-2S domain-containing protein [Rhodomicrobium sp.]
MADFAKVAYTNEIEPGQALLVDVKGKQIALFNVDGQFFALDNTCAHRGGPLAEGEVLGHEVTCLWHGATFDVRTGEVVGPPSTADCRTLRRPRDRNHDIEVEL